MARLQVSYHMPDGRGRYYPFFINYIDSVKVLADETVYEIIEKTLKTEYGVKEITIDNGIMEIEFPTEEDITTFLVRWS